jgi:hypothetical protein
MSNKTQLQTNNTQYASLIETLRGKAVPSGGEDVADETEAYTAKLASLETAISALESELEGKASGGGSGGADIELCSLTFNLNCSARYVTYSESSGISSAYLKSAGAGSGTYGTILPIVKGTMLYVPVGSGYAFTLPDGITMLEQTIYSTLFDVASNISDTAIISGYYNDL